MTNTVLGGISTRQFLQKYWQKKPLLIRNAFPKFQGLLNKAALLSLAYSEEAQSRLIAFNRKKWSLQHGPFKKQDFNSQPRNWTLLVQDINHFLPEATRLLQAFNFIPHARLDDLMVSFATDGSGVGPHVDSYDVFLLQGLGKRLWQISKQKDQQLLPDAPLKILKNFQPEQEWILEAGDMLYLPPNYAHNGIAVGESMTYSIGFRAASAQELSDAFLNYLQDHLQVAGRYKDPDLRMTQHPAHINSQMIDKVTDILEQIRFGKKEIAEFLGKYLTEPKTHVFFNAPEKILSRKAFLKLAKTKGICLDLRSQMLFTDRAIFMNGEAYSMVPLLKKLADDREITFSAPENSLAEELLYTWYLDGYLSIRKH
jgi:50S ribosomal protein L16 3-hydroxylase